MAGNELDPIRARAARDVIRQHPAMVLFVVSPVIVGVGLIWWLAGAGWAIFTFLALAFIAGVVVSRKR
jgi:hypothetical protein